MVTVAAHRMEHLSASDGLNFTYLHLLWGTESYNKMVQIYFIDIILYLYNLFQIIDTIHSTLTRINHTN